MTIYGPKGTGDVNRNNLAALSAQTKPTVADCSGGGESGELTSGQTCIDQNSAVVTMTRAVTYGATSLEMPQGFSSNTSVVQIYSDVDGTDQLVGANITDADLSTLDGNLQTNTGGAAPWPWR